MADRAPAIFFGHGNPLNALASNAWTDGWAALGKDIPTPRAVLCVSAHWYVPTTLVTGSSAPRTIHDFGGFPRELYEVKYPAPGDPELARHVQELLAPVSVGLDELWGLDHGTWSVLCHAFPEADVPVIQLSIDETQPSEFHYETAKRLGSLRDEAANIRGILGRHRTVISRSCEAGLKFEFLLLGFLGQSFTGCSLEHCMAQFICCFCQAAFLGDPVAST